MAWRARGTSSSIMFGCIQPQTLLSVSLCWNRPVEGSSDDHGRTERMATAPRGQRLLMAAAIVVATAAGIVGAIMLIAPSSTGRYFAWPSGPQALAALVGGFYVVSTPVFAYAGRRPAIEVRGLAGLPIAAILTAIPFALIHMPLHFIGDFTVESLA